VSSLNPNDYKAKSKHDMRSNNRCRLKQNSNNITLWGYQSLGIKILIQYRIMLIICNILCYVPSPIFLFYNARYKRQFTPHSSTPPPIKAQATLCDKQL